MNSLTLYLLGWMFSSFNPESVPADQWRFCELLGKEECKNRLEAHWNTWVTEDDIKTLSEAVSVFWRSIFKRYCQYSVVDKISFFSVLILRA